VYPPLPARDKAPAKPGVPRSAPQTQPHLAAGGAPVVPDLRTDYSFGRTTELSPVGRARGGLPAGLQHPGLVRDPRPTHEPRLEAQATRGWRRWRLPSCRRCWNG